MKCRGHAGPGVQRSTAVSLVICSMGRALPNEFLKPKYRNTQDIGKCTRKSTTTPYASVSQSVLISLEGLKMSCMQLMTLDIDAASFVAMRIYDSFM